MTEQLKSDVFLPAVLVIFCPTAMSDEESKCRTLLEMLPS